MHRLVSLFSALVGSVVLATAQPAPSPADSLTNGLVSAVRTKRPAFVTFLSEPDSAQVILNDRPVGYTPLTLSMMAAETAQVIIRRTYYRPWNASFVPSEGDSATVSVRLASFRSTISVYANRPDASIFLDDTLIAAGEAYRHEVTIGPHRLRVVDVPTGTTVATPFSVQIDQAVAFRADFRTISYARAGLAFLVPGVPQISDGAWLKGGAMVIGTGALGLATLNAWSYHNDRLAAYDRSWLDYLEAPTEVEAVRRHEEVDRRKADLNTAYLRRNVFLGLFLAAYAYSVIDALTGHLLVDRIEVVPVVGNPYTPASVADVPAVGAHVRFSLR